ncbi:integrase [Pseudomonas sp. NIBR-H-19]|uniref:integrase n=1 Tax=Pseudomonas sp. NIBR-H-19 TaxID=2901380 RepID=UPI001E28CAAA|nr:integrase [Pseudomonas sp. NIBR-H-19]UHC80187.1 integrase [Pseudomonas sp. NIBR-H-19]
MSDNTLVTATHASFAAQPSDVCGLSEAERDALIISCIQVDGTWLIVSRYADDTWYLTGFNSNVRMSRKHLNFGTIPPAFREVMKAIIYRYLRRGRYEGARPKSGSALTLFENSKPFLRHLEALKIDHISAANPMVCKTYVDTSKAQGNTRLKGKPFSQQGLERRFGAVEALYGLSQYTDDRIPSHPWPETSAAALAGRTGRGYQDNKTQLMPDDVFCIVFERAYQQVERGPQLLDFRDALDALTKRLSGRPRTAIYNAKTQKLRALGWEGSLNSFNRALSDLRTSCYIVLASTSGCRNHELAYVQLGAHHRTEDEEGVIYHWMRSRSEKTDLGIHDWMIPEAAVRALRLMERWSTPYQSKLASEIMQRRRANPLDPQIAETQKHRHALFLGLDKKVNQVRTLCNESWNFYLKRFTKDCGLSWGLSSHQFRRKFANYAAHSRFGDLRYLKEHFAHWSLDMTLGYAMDDKWGQHMDLDLYSDIQGELEDIKLGIVDNWVGDERLAGEYGRALKQWQREPQNLLIFKDHASMLKSIAESTSIRSNGHAWCTADNDGCVGNTLERTRCGNCTHAVIGRNHAPIYQRLYDDLKGLLNCRDIGESGRQRVERDLNRCHEVLIQLGMESETLIA